ncbi:MAG: hypothetical protein KDB37_01730 [Ilumatobacter sp.]|nr:hypothetical protein [Ilumatobacter sp.]
MRTALDPDGPFGRFAERLLMLELPDLPDDRRASTVAFVSHRAHQVPGPLRAGVTLLSVATGVAERVVEPDRVVAFLRSTELPLVGELARMVRSLAFAYVWETWPSTTPTGGAG